MDAQIILPVPLIRLLFFTAFILANILLHAQDYVSGNYWVRHYTDEDGLPQNSVKELHLGHKGEVWIITHGGLSEFDGASFRHWDKNALGLKRSQLYNLFTLPGSRLSYLYALDSNYVGLNKNKPQVFKSAPFATYVNRLRESVKGFHDEGFTHMVSLFHPCKIKSVDDVAVLVPMPKQGLYLLKKDSLFYSQEGNIRWRTSTYTNYQYFYLGNRFFIWDWKHAPVCFTADGKADTLDFGQKVRNIVFNRPDKQVFIVLENNALYMLKENGSLEYLLDMYPHFDFESALRIDDETLILGSNSKGFLFCKKQKFRTVASTKTEHTVYYGIRDYDDSTVLTSNGYIVGGSNIKVPFRKNGKSTHLYMNLIAKGKQGNYYFNTEAIDADLVSYDKKGNYLSYLKTPSISTMRAVSELDNGLLWFADEEKSLYAFDGETLLKKTQSPAIVRKIHVLSKKHLLLGTDDGLFLYDKPLNMLLEYKFTRGLRVNNIIPSPRGGFYITVGENDIFYLKDMALRRLPLDKNGWLRSANCLLVDKAGMVWISNNRGLFCILEEELLNPMYEDGKAPYYYFGKDNGFRTNEFNGGCYPCGVSLNNGEVVFPSMDGLVWFDPQSVYFRFPKHKPKLSNILVNNEELQYVRDTLTLKTKQKQLELHYQVSFWGDRANNLYVEYGYRKKDEPIRWHTIPSDVPILLTGIYPGYSTLYLRVRSGLGKDDYMYTTLVLYRTPAIWETVYIWPIAIGTLLIFIFISMQLYTIRLKRRNKELEEAVQKAQETILVNMQEISESNKLLTEKNRFFNWLVSSVVHDIKGPLRFVVEMGDMYGKSDEPDKFELRFLRAVLLTSRKIYAYSDRLIQALLTQRGENLAPENIHVHKVITEKVEQFRLTLDSKRILVELAIQQETFDVNPLAFEIILHNLLDNSIKSQHGGRILVSFYKEGAKHVLRVKDEGAGLPEDLLKLYGESSNEIPYTGSRGLGIWLIFSMVRFTQGVICFANQEKGLSVEVRW